VKWIKPLKKRDGYYLKPDDGIARDGETVRTRMLLMDSKIPWRSGYALLSDAEAGRPRARA
jgi:hypothetical protein